MWIKYGIGRSSSLKVEALALSGSGQRFLTQDERLEHLCRSNWLYNTKLDRNYVRPRVLPTGELLLLVEYQFRFPNYGSANSPSGLGFQGWSAQVKRTGNFLEVSGQLCSFGKICHCKPWYFQRDRFRWHSCALDSPKVEEARKGYLGRMSP